MVWLVIRETVRGDAEKTLLTVGVSLGWAVRRDCPRGALKTTPPRAFARGGGWFRFAVFDAAGSLVAGKSPGGEHRREILAVDGPVTVEVGGAGGRAVVARSAFGPAAAEFGAVGFRVDPAST